MCLLFKLDIHWEQMGKGITLMCATFKTAEDLGISYDLSDDTKTRVVLIMRL